MGSLFAPTSPYLLASWWTDNWFSIVAGLAIAVVVAELYYLRSKKERLPICSISSETIIGIKADIPELTIHFARHGEPLKSLSVAKVCFWNGGSDAILKKHWPKSDPPCITVRDGQNILFARVVGETEPNNRFRVRLNRSKTKAVISFDYLNRRDGAAVKVFFNGESGNDLSVQAKLIDCQPLKVLRGIKDDPQLLARREVLRSLVNLTTMLVMTAFIGFNLMLPKLNKGQPVAGDILQVVGIMVAGAMGVFIGRTLIVLRRWRARVPLDLKEPMPDENTEEPEEPDL